MGWNLPPGVEINMIPGNRPEDEEFELYLDEVYSYYLQRFGSHIQDLSESEFSLVERRWREEQMAYDTALDLHDRRVKEVLIGD